MSRWPAMAFAALFLAGLIQVAWQHQRLPETVATHFDSVGHANGWMTRNTHTALHLGLLLFVSLLLEGIARVDRWLPTDKINLPDREHWLAPAQRDATLAWLSNMARLAASVILAFFLGLFHQIYRANRMENPILTDSTFALVVAMLVAMAAILAVTLLRFRRPAA